MVKIVYNNNQSQIVSTETLKDISLQDVSHIIINDNGISVDDVIFWREEWSSNCEAANEYALQLGEDMNELYEDDSPESIEWHRLLNECK